MNKAARIFGAGPLSDAAMTVCPKNQAFVFVKPHATVGGGAVEALVREKLRERSIVITAEGSIDHSMIDEKKLIDTHYGAIAAKASLLRPEDTNPSREAQEQFGMKFGLSWPDALSSGLVLNAMDACKKLGVDGDQMETLWVDAKARGELLKFGGGFYCASIATPGGSVEVEAAPNSLFVINGFYMAMRDCYTRAG